ncbi:MAG: hypothetical protein GY757_54645 [bacterium]|nr:hypothetical protein [bacterium]
MNFKLCSTCYNRADNGRFPIGRPHCYRQGQDVDDGTSCDSYRESHNNPSTHSNLWEDVLEKL